MVFLVCWYFYVGFCCYLLVGCFCVGVFDCCVIIGCYCVCYYYVVECLYFGLFVD